jgi:hypothetical protein
LCNFQIDLIFTKPKFYESSLNYFAYNDLGNLLGRGAEQISGKLGASGGRALAGLLGSKDPRSYAKTGADVGRSLGGKLGGLLRKIPFKKGGVVRRRRMRRTVTRRRR